MNNPVDQMELFGRLEPEPRYPNAPGFKSNLSEETAIKLKVSASRLRAVVLTELGRHPAGCTADEIAGILGRSPLYVRPRVTELNKLGKIVATGHRRRNESGLPATVWRAA